MITSTSNNRIKELSSLLDKAKERRRAGVYIIEGPRMFEEAPISDVKEVYLSESFAAKYGIADLSEGKEKQPAATDASRIGSAAPEGASDRLLAQLSSLHYEIVADNVFRKISETQNPQGVLAILKQKEYRLDEILAGKYLNPPKAQTTPTSRTAEAVSQASGTTKPLLLILEDIQDPGNLGTMIRAGEGAGLTGVIMSKGTVDIYNPKTIRSTMGSIFRIPFVYTEDLSGAIAQVKRSGIRTYAAHLKGEAPYEASDYTESAAFLIGNEGNGLSDEIANLADTYIKIPMLGQVESLNASVAASVLMYEAARQRRK